MKRLAYRDTAVPIERSQKAPDIRWVAGLFEGEGTVTLNTGGRKPYTRLVAIMGNTERTLVELFAGRWPAAVRERKRQKMHHKRSWVWTLQCRRAAAFLREIYPHVRGLRMRRRIELGLEAQSKRRQGNRRDKGGYRRMQTGYLQRMRILNAKGDPEFTVGDRLIPRLRAGRLALTAGEEKA